MKEQYLIWGKELETGLECIDNQHKGLINTLNELLVLKNDGSNRNEELIIKILEKLNLYIDEHFTTEELLMTQYDVDLRHRVVHLQEHNNFKKDIIEYFKADKLMLEKYYVGEAVVFLFRWLVYHILDVDKRLTMQLDFIKSSKLSSTESYDYVEGNLSNGTEPLLKVLNSLFIIIEEKNKELIKLNNELEERVAKRTNELKEAYLYLKNLSIHDELTGLYNRRYALDRLETAYYEWKRYNQVFSILFIDLDGFKLVNDTYGHANGDFVLEWVANFLKSNTRNSDLVCRFGGDEFLVVCINCCEKDAFSLADKLQLKLQTNTDFAISKIWNPSLSIGVSEIKNEHNGINDLLTEADKAMYSNKGKNIVN